MRCAVGRAEQAAEYLREQVVQENDEALCLARQNGEQTVSGFVEQHINQHRTDEDNQDVRDEEKILRPERICGQREEKSAVGRHYRIVAMNEVDAESVSRHGGNRFCGAAVGRNGTHCAECHKERHGRKSDERVVVAVHMPRPRTFTRNRGEQCDNGVIQQHGGGKHAEPEGGSAFRSEPAQGYEPAVHIYYARPEQGVAVVRPYVREPEVGYEAYKTTENDACGDEQSNAFSVELFREFIEKRRDYAERAVDEHEPIFRGSGKTAYRRVCRACVRGDACGKGYEFAEGEIDVSFEQQLYDFCGFEPD